MPSHESLTALDSVQDGWRRIWYLTRNLNYGIPRHGRIALFTETFFKLGLSQQGRELKAIVSKGTIQCRTFRLDIAHSAPSRRKVDPQYRFFGVKLRSSGKMTRGIRPRAILQIAHASRVQ